MRIELVLLVVLTLSVLSLLSSLPRFSSDRIVLSTCTNLVIASSIHGGEVSIPCRLSDGYIVYGDAREPFSSTSYGVIVNGKHWPPP